MAKDDDCFNPIIGPVIDLYRSIPITSKENTVDEIGEWYAKKDAEAKRLREHIRDLEFELKNLETRKKLINDEEAVLREQIDRMKKKLEQAEYVGD